MHSTVNSFNKAKIESLFNKFISNKKIDSDTKLEDFLKMLIDFIEKSDDTLSEKDKVWLLMTVLPLTEGGSLIYGENDGR